MIAQPEIVTPRSVDIPTAELTTTKNGVKIYNLTSDDFEVVRFSFVFKAGTSMQHKPFTASATANTGAARKPEKTCSCSMAGRTG
jgi:hypothetical protein